MNDKKCGYPPCKCHDTSEGGYCSTYCETFGAALMGQVQTEPDNLEPKDPARLKCGCGHRGCAEYH